MQQRLASSTPEAGLFFSRFLAKSQPQDSSLLSFSHPGVRLRLSLTPAKKTLYKDQVPLPSPVSKGGNLSCLPRLGTYNLVNTLGKEERSPSWPHFIWQRDPPIVQHVSKSIPFYSFHIRKSVSFSHFSLLMSLRTRPSHRDILFSFWHLQIGVCGWWRARMWQKMCIFPGLHEILCQCQLNPIDWWYFSVSLFPKS